VAATRIGYALRPVFALELAGVSKHYGRRAALHRVDLALARGAALGPEGKMLRSVAKPEDK
jgi:hypothetical protein